MIDYEHILGEQLEVEPDLITPEVVNFFKECVDMTALYARKNHDYGNSFANGLKEIGNAYAVGRLYDKMNRLITLSKNTHAAISDESMEDTVRDLACYSVMLLNEWQKRNEEDLLPGIINVKPIYNVGDTVVFESGGLTLQGVISAMDETFARIIVENKNNSSIFSVPKSQILYKVEYA